jgi:hypothetical protein
MLDYAAVNHVGADHAAEPGLAFDNDRSNARFVQEIRSRKT